MEMSPNRGPKNGEALVSEGRACVPGEDVEDSEAQARKRGSASMKGIGRPVQLGLAVKVCRSAETI